MSIFESESDAFQVRRDLIIKYKKVFTSPDGQDVLQDMIKTGRVFQDVMAESDKDTFYNIGMRDMVLRIVRTVATDKNYMDEIQKMINKG